MKNSGFKTVETNLDELDDKIHEHRKKIFKRVIRILAVIAALIVLVVLWDSLKSYDSFDTKNSEERSDSEAVKFMQYKGKILKYSNDGASYMNSADEQIWNQSFEMSSPVIDVCEDYMAIYDHGGTSIYIMTDKGLKKEIDTTMPIQVVNVASQGTVAVLMKEDKVSYIKL